MSENLEQVNHPKHYTSHPSGIECIEINELFQNNLGCCFKYLWRAGLKGDQSKLTEDIQKSKWYLSREISHLEYLRSKHDGCFKLEYILKTLTNDEYKFLYSLYNDKTISKHMEKNYGQVIDGILYFHTNSVQLYSSGKLIEHLQGLLNYF